MGEHKYNDAYKTGFKRGMKNLIEYLLYEKIGCMCIEEPDEKEEYYNKAISDIAEILTEQLNKIE